jgi:hypothetical protein
MDKGTVLRYAAVIVGATLVTGCAVGMLGEVGALEAIEVAEVAGAGEAALVTRGIGLAGVEAGAEAAAGVRLGSFLASEAAAGGGEATFTLARSGAVSVGSRALVGEWTSEGLLGVRTSSGAFRAMGRLIGNELWETTTAGRATTAIGMVRGATVARGLWLRASPSTGATAVELLRPQVQVVVEQLSDNWFRVSVPSSGAHGWLPASLVEASIITAVGSSRDSSRVRIVSSEQDADAQVFEREGSDATLALEGGQSLVARDLEHRAGFWMFSSSNGRRMTIADAQVRGIRPLLEDAAATAQPLTKWIRLVDGRVIAAISCVRQGAIMRLERLNAAPLLLDAALVASVCGE